MPTWSEILKEIKISSVKNDPSSIDRIRRKYLNLLHSHTGRNVILYASAFGQKPGPPALTSITDEDIQGIMEVVFGLEKIPTDLILHSPGGSPEAAEAIVNYLHLQFPEIRVIIPQIAMSAATMMSCSCSSIVMGKHSSIGPVDPQLIINSPNGPTSNPAQAIIDQFYLALKEINEIDKRSWSILLHQYGPSLITQCKNYIEMSELLVKEWLYKYMFSLKPELERIELSETISKYLSKHENFKSHGRHISRDTAEGLGLIIEHLEDDDKLQDYVLSVFHAATHAFSLTPAFKIMENHKGKAFIKIFNPS